MAGTAQFVFNEKAADKLRNPDDLERYIRVTNPSVWAVLAACAALLAGLLAWGVFGSVTTNVVATGAVVDGKAACFLSVDEAAKVSIDDSASFGGVDMRVSDVARVPLSLEEAKGKFDSDFLAASLVKDDWVYQVAFEGDVSRIARDVPQSVMITVERVAPISLVLENWG